MSHTMNIKLEIRDMDALILACGRIDGLSTIGYGSHRLFRTNEVGYGVKLDGWKYPVIIKESGDVTFDNYEGHWGDIKKLNELTAYYGVEKAKIEARRAGHDFYEIYNKQDQTVELRINIA